MPTTSRRGPAEGEPATPEHGDAGAGHRFPPPAPATVPRPRLIERLRRAVPGQVVLLRAPAGYSKTTCLREWAEVDERPFAFVACNARHDDPAVLIESIVEALEEFQAVDSGVLQALAALKPDIDTVISRLGKSIETSGDPVVIALDDLHAVSAPATHEALRGLVGVLPPNAQLAIATRTEPPLPLGRMRTNRAVAEVGPATLAMTPQESGLMIGGMGIELGEADLSTLHERTEGWPAALYLAGLALVEQADPSAAVADFAGDDRLVVDYLRDEFLATLTPAKARFLIRCSVLDELSGPVCDAALDRTGSARLLQGLARENALIVPLDRKDDRYRCHHMLAEMLRSELLHREPEVAAGIHARAGRWYSDHGDLDRAIEHAIAAGETDRAGELVWLAIPELTGRGRLATLDRWLAEIGEGGIASSAPLALSSSHRHIALGDGGGAAHWARVAAAAATASGGADAALEGDLHLIAATLGADGVVRMGEEAERAAELIAADSPWQSPCNLYRGVSVHLGGHPDRAAPLLREAARRGAIASPVIQGLALAQLALIAGEDGETDAGARLISQAHEQVVRCDLFDYPSMAMIFATAALLYGTAGRVEQAMDHIAHGRDLVEECTSFPLWYEVQVRIVLARACLRVDDLEAATQLLRAADAFLADLPDAPLLTQWSAQARAAIEQAGERHRAYSLTKAELRTLQYLPTHLSFREIGERLFLSANTVKTQARAVYRKLDASSRAETVQRAREAGLLAGEQASGPDAPGPIGI